jgi:hypothetical protein
VAGSNISKIGQTAFIYLSIVAVVVAHRAVIIPKQQHKLVVNNKRYICGCTSRRNNSLTTAQTACQ